MTAARTREEDDASCRLAVYGSLIPGGSNHHIVEPLGGEWTQGFVIGELLATGWAASLGYKAFRPRADGARIAVHMLTSPRLRDDWPRLDAFEGPGYIRILVDVMQEVNGSVELLAVANLYAAADPEHAAGG